MQCVLFIELYIGNFSGRLFLPQSLLTVVLRNYIMAVASIALTPELFYFVVIQTTVFFSNTINEMKNDAVEYAINKASVRIRP